MLWHRQAIFESKGDKLSSSAECRIRTQGLRHLFASRSNACWQTDWAIEDQAKNIHTYIHACMHTCIHTYIRTYIHTYLHTCVLTHVRTYIHTCIHTNIHTYTHIFIYLSQFLYERGVPLHCVVVGEIHNGHCDDKYSKLAQALHKTSLGDRQWPIGIRDKGGFTSPAITLVFELCASIIPVSFVEYTQKSDVVGCSSVVYLLFKVNPSFDYIPRFMPLGITSQGQWITQSYSVKCAKWGWMISAKWSFFLRNEI